MPTSYIPHGLTLSNAQIQKLRKGDTIRITHKNLNGAHQIHLTNAQIKKIQHAYAAGKGVDLKMSAAQLKYNLKNGSGLFDII
jgi:hypothetical protein